MIRVAIADDQELVRSGIRLILEGEADMQVVWEARNGEEAIELVSRERPDVLLLDIRMPGKGGIAAAVRILAAMAAGAVARHLLGLDRRRMAGIAVNFRVRPGERKMMPAGMIVGCQRPRVIVVAVSAGRA